MTPLWLVAWDSARPRFRSMVNRHRIREVELKQAHGSPARYPRLGQLLRDRARDRGGLRRSRGQARLDSFPRGGGARGVCLRFQYLYHSDRRDRPGQSLARECGGHAFLQPGPQDASSRGDSPSGNLGSGRRPSDCGGTEAREDADPRRGRPRILYQPHPGSPSWRKQLSALRKVRVSRRWIERSRIGDGR